MEIISSKLFVCMRFPVRHGGIGSQLNRKLWANSFLSGMRLWCIISTGSDWRKVSRPAWGYGVLSQQETICEKFPVRHGGIGFISTGNYWRTVSCSACEQWEPPQQETICEKFPVRHGEIGFIATGNYEQTVSCPACEQWDSSQQETICRPFPVRHGAMVHHLNRKL